MTSFQVVAMSDITTDNIPSQDNLHPHDVTAQSHVTHRLKPFTLVIFSVTTLTLKFSTNPLTKTVRIPG